MGKRGLFSFLGAVVFFSATAMASDNLAALQKLNQRQLDELYHEATPGQIPSGTSEGKAIVFPGTWLTYPAATLAALAWQGKIFQSQPGTDQTILFNRVFGFKAVKAKVYLGKSWLDGEESIIVDYQDTSLLFSSIRDEIREIQPGVYLGRAYFRTLLGPVFALNFALEFAD